MNSSRHSMNSLPPGFVSAMRTLFNVLDFGGSGYVCFQDIAAQWGQGETALPRGLPKDFVNCLRRVTPPNGLLTFERFCAGLRLALAEERTPLDFASDPMYASNGSGQRSSIASSALSFAGNDSDGFSSQIQSGQLRQQPNPMQQFLSYPHSYAAEFFGDNLNRGTTAPAVSCSLPCNTDFPIPNYESAMQQKARTSATSVLFPHNSAVRENQAYARSQQTAHSLEQGIQSLQHIDAAASPNRPSSYASQPQQLESARPRSAVDFVVKRHSLPPQPPNKTQKSVDRARQIFASVTTASQLNLPGFSYPNGAYDGANGSAAEIPAASKRASAAANYENWEHFAAKALQNANMNVSAYTSAAKRNSATSVNNCSSHSAVSDNKRASSSLRSECNSSLSNMNKSDQIASMLLAWKDTQLAAAAANRSREGEFSTDYRSMAHWLAYRHPQLCQDSSEKTNTTTNTSSSTRSTGSAYFLPPLGRLQHSRSQPALNSESLMQEEAIRSSQLKQMYASTSVCNDTSDYSFRNLGDDSLLECTANSSNQPKRYAGSSSSSTSPPQDPIPSNSSAIRFAQRPSDAATKSTAELCGIDVRQMQMPQNPAMDCSAGQFIPPIIKLRHKVANNAGSASEMLRRHSLAEMSETDPTTAKHKRALEEEKMLLQKAKEISNRLRNWYSERLKSIETRQKFIAGKTTIPLDFAVHEQKLNYLRAHVTEVNRRITSLMESSEKGFPSQINLEYSRSIPQPADDEVRWLKNQIRMLAEEVSEKSAMIAIQKREKNFLQSQLQLLLNQQNQAFTAYQPYAGESSAQLYVNGWSDADQTTNNRPQLTTLKSLPVKTNLATLM